MAPHQILEAARAEQAAYSGGADRPLRSYATLMLTYAGMVGGLAALAAVTRRRIPRLGFGDVALMSITTHRLARLIAKDAVTSPLRAPFTRYRGVQAPAELAEEVRGSGLRHAVGELITCPLCMAQWVGTGYAAGMVFAPGLTRLAGATMTAIAAADWMQFGYSILEQRAEAGPEEQAGDRPEDG